SHRAALGESAATSWVCGELATGCLNTPIFRRVSVTAGCPDTALAAARPDRLQTAAAHAPPLSRVCLRGNRLTANIPLGMDGGMHVHIKSAFEERGLLAGREHVGWSRGTRPSRGAADEEDFQLARHPGLGEMDVPFRASGEAHSCEA